ncbi:non-muscle caldesmon [Megalops cyprinoides]|uniref:non-muscle caldesmon n=1 Tax=Megalops cyprinoides TaxID=118141 RepID=UPI001864045B|nr:non-muscle caldesmon [Megalops cyprinoides]
MSSAILRRNSSKQGLQNLLKVTAQRSIEDAEEIERERRRRAREVIRSTSSQSNSGPMVEDNLYEGELKPSSQQSLEEDEGFSDWTQKLERRRQRRLEEQGQTEEEEWDQNVAVERTRHTTRLAKGWGDEEQEEDWRRKESERKRWRECEEAMQGDDRVCQQKERDEEAKKLREEEKMKAVKKKEPDQITDEEGKAKEKRKEVKVSYTSEVFLQQEAKHINSNGNAAGEEVMSHLVKTKRTPRSLSQTQESNEEAEVFLETEQKLEKIRRSHQEKESQELEQLRQRQAEAEVELEELKKRREERRKVREEEERRREEEDYQRQLREEEEKRHMKEEIERRRMEAAERRMKNLSTSSADGEEPFSPLSPRSPSFKSESDDRVTAESTYSITERTESLNRSLKKSNSIKKMQSPLLTSKIDDKLEQYSHAIEISSKETRASKQGLMDIPSPPEPVSSKKSLFEAGEVWNQNSLKSTPTKDAEGLKVGVADLITQWVKGNPDSSRTSPSKPADIKAGDVLHKKNLWESIGETSTSGRAGPGGKGTPSGKRYKFVVTGHGKYEKIPVSDGDYDVYMNGKSTGLCHEES